MSKKNRAKKHSARDFRGLPRLKPPVVQQTYFGTQRASGEPSSTYDDRRTRCFELATYAVVFGSVPEGSLLVHGSWHGPGASERIAHAWVELPGGFVWEPITCCVYEKASFEHWTACWPEMTYTKAQAQQMVHQSGTYGSWHGSKYPSTPLQGEGEVQTTT